jgi:hypothetical protein
MLLVATLMLPVPCTEAWAASATGHVAVALGDEGPRSLSFRAMSVNEQESTAAGEIDFHDPNPIANQDVDDTGEAHLEDAPGGVRLQANVDCLYVQGNQAVIGGQVTSASVPRYVGMWVLLFIEDGLNQSTRDRCSWGFYPAVTGTGCDSFPLAAHDAIEIESGDLQVQQ